MGKLCALFGRKGLTPAFCSMCDQVASPDDTGNGIRQRVARFQVNPPPAKADSAFAFVAPTTP